MLSADINPLLVQKYNQPVPRYTSYPTVPFWEDSISKQDWEQAFASRFEAVNHVNGISLYLHLPFCESLCTYCGCNKKITTNHSVEEVYLDALQKEWMLYRKLMKQTPLIREIHLGGGTPSFFSPANLKRIVETVLGSAIIYPRHHFSIEGHPNNTTPAHLAVLYKLGFRRISYGVQDMDPRVQYIINRMQPFENVKNATENARKAGFTSVNFDLIYGLPLQTVESITRTIEQVISLRPDRIAFYSYAHVPWTSKGQRLFDESHLPSAEEKLELYLTGKKLLQMAGYADIGMDHFALPTEELYIARESGRLHRNFMGYTTQQSGLLLGLGVSAISDLGTAYAQNEKTLHDYYTKINSGSLATRKGYFLTEQDGRFKQYILDLCCRGKTVIEDFDLPLVMEHSGAQLIELEEDGLIYRDGGFVVLTSTGHYFIRNVCSAFDLYLNNSEEAGARFSKAI